MVRFKVMIISSNFRRKGQRAFWHVPLETHIRPFALFTLVAYL